MNFSVQKSFNKRQVGCLYLVATPIGNLDDMTYRAVRTLQEVEWIAAEDTRQSKKLLNHFSIDGKLVSYHAHNQHTSGPELIRLLKNGESVALISDAGLPAISDPGNELVQLAVEEEIPVIPIPGANAALSALIASGLPTETFSFIGFLPRENKKRKTILEKWKSVDGTLLFYESPYRVKDTLQDLLECYGSRSVGVVRELTKIHEEWIRGQLEDVIKHVEDHLLRGEVCIVLEGRTNEIENSKEWWFDLSLQQHLDFYMIGQGLDRKTALKSVAADRRVPKREVYNELLT